MDENRSLKLQLEELSDEATLLRSENEEKKLAILELASVLDAHMNGALSEGLNHII